ncbi:MAG TPA: penicillin acylase family protein [Actinomycetota bacterium]|nr:penicillin acylase family protein [Actinomycetota bacterium]
MADFLDGLRAAAGAALFPLTGELRVTGLQAPVEVLRDRYGVAYLSAGSLDDLWFTQGFVTAGERLFQMDLALKQANGRLSELFGELTLDDDRFTRTVGINRAGATIAAGWDETSRSMIARFRAGASAWIEAMPAPPVEYVLLDAQPDLPADDASWAACWAMFSWALSGNWDMELLRTHLAAELGDEAAGRLLPPLVGHPTAPAAGRLAGELLRELPHPPRGLGSNEWAVAGSRTASGLPLLANDPHLLVQQPGAWIELHLRAPGYEARGVAAPFAPGIVLGTTAHHAWGATNVCGDVQDLYLERLNDQGTAARYEDAWEPFTIHREEIRVRGSDEPLVHEVRATRHGPLLDSYLTGRLRPTKRPLDGAFALRWVGAEHSIRPSALIDVANVSTFEGFRDAARALECPGQNLVYADVEGTIGYQCTGLHPIRRTGDGTVPVPGWSAEHEWEGFIPFEDLPTAVDPERGYLVTANDRIHDDHYPHLIGHDFHASDRATRITELLEERSDHTVETSRRIQADTVSLSARSLVPRMALAHDRARRILDRWDHDLAASSGAAALWEVFLDELARRALGGREPLIEEYLTDRELFRCRALPAMIDEDVLTADDRDDALAAAWDRCVADMGSEPEDWRWGDIHRARFAHPLGRMPGLEPLFVAADHALGGNEQTVNNAGFEGEGPFRVYVAPSWRVVYDLSDLDASAGILPTGQSGNPASPHWNDQTELWAAGALRPLPFSRPAVEAAATERLAMLPG